MKKKKPPKPTEKSGLPEISLPESESSKSGLLKRFLAWIARGSKNATCPT